MNYFGIKVNLATLYKHVKFIAVHIIKGLKVLAFLCLCRKFLETTGSYILIVCVLSNFLHRVYYEAPTNILPLSLVGPWLPVSAISSPFRSGNPHHFSVQTFHWFGLGYPVVIFITFHAHTMKKNHLLYDWTVSMPCLPPTPSGRSTPLKIIFFLNFSRLRH